MKLKTKKRLVILSVILALSAGLGLLLALRSESDQSVTNTVDYSGPTNEEREAGDKKKKDLVEEDRQAGEQEQPANNSAQVTITYVGQSTIDNSVEVNSFTTHYEDGVCTIRLTKDGTTVEREVDAFRDTTTTVCSNPTIERAAFDSAGSWRVQVSYVSSSGITGTSETQQINIK